MNKLLFFFILIIIVLGCRKQTELLDNGLTREAEKVTEFIIKVEFDSIKNQTKDTLALTERYFNNKQKIIKSIRKMLFDKETEIIEINYIYNKFNKIEKEIVEISLDSLISTVYYFYKDSLLYQTKSNRKNIDFHFSLIGTYKYHPNNELKEISISQIYLDLKSNDTTLNSIQVNKYDKKEFLIESKTIDLLNPIANSSSKSKYDNGLLIKVQKYNSEDSLISTTNYKYKFDKFNNWIIRESFENNKLKYLRTRIIEYK